MISIIIPTRNEEKTIVEILKKLQDLRKAGHEIILSDGMSTDHTRELARPYVDRIVEENDSGKRTIARGKNRGANFARGEYLLFLDADMVLPNPREYIGKALSYFKTNPKLVGLTVPLKVSPELETFADRMVFGIVNCLHRFSNNILRTGSASGEFQLVTREAFRKLRGYNEYLPVTEDNEFFKRLARIGRTRFEPTLTAFHSGRRAHALGWPKLIWSWIKNAIYVTVFHRSADKEWIPIR